MSRRILFANVTMAGHSGTEIVTRDLALGMAARGHDVTVYAPDHGPLSVELAAAGVRVVSNLDADLRAPEIVHGHHYMQTVEALLRFPDARGIFACHDRTAPHSIPPRLARLVRYIAVDENCLERLRDDWRIQPSQTRVTLNAVDTSRFRSRGPLPSSPARALVFSHYASPATHAEVVRDACSQFGIAVDVVGTASGSIADAPESLIPRYDLVFAKARCALEAMAVGCAVILCDAAGTGPMVTKGEAAALRPWNFGARVLTGRLDRDALVREIRRYDPSDAAAVSGYIRKHADLAGALSEYEQVYDEALAAPLSVASSPSRSSTPIESITELTEPLLARIGELESNLDGYRRPDRMIAIPDDAGAALSITIDNAPRAMKPGANGFVRATLTNRLPGQAVGSWPPYPVQWGYRWRPEAAAEFLPVDSLRTPIRRAVAPDETAEFGVEVKAPEEPGRYILRITLVQEQLRWLDDAMVPVLAETPITISD